MCDRRGWVSGWIEFMRVDACVCVCVYLRGQMGGGMRCSNSQIRWRRHSCLHVCVSIIYISILFLSPDNKYLLTLR